LLPHLHYATQHTELPPSARILDRFAAARQLLADGANEFQVPLNALDPANPALQDSVDDIGRLSHLNEATLYHLIASRFLVGKAIYTRAGPVLVALNPFSPQPKLYATQVLESYQRQAKVEHRDARARLPSHTTP
jgi:myosin heavy subunit